MISISNDQFITGEKVYLRPFKESDLKMISRLENHPDPRATLFYAIPTTLDQQYEKIKKMINDPSNIVLIICTKENSEAIGEALIKLISDKNLRETMAEAGYKRILNHFDAEKMAEEYEKIYSDVI